MTRQEWIIEFNRWLTERMENIDDDTFIQLFIAERYVNAWGTLPSVESDSGRLNKAVQIFHDAMLEIGPFPNV